jgi:hypothetical protein
MVNFGLFDEHVKTLQVKRLPLDLHRLDAKHGGFVKALC